MITCEIIDRDNITKYHAEWELLFNSGAYEASLSVEWTQALLHTHLAGDRFFLMVLKDAASIVGYVPLCIKKVKKQGVSLLTLFPLAEYFNTHSDMLLKNASEELVEVFIKALFSLPYNWDIFRINRFIENSACLNSIARSLKSNIAYRYDIRPAEPSFFISLGTSYKEFLEKRSANFRYKLKSSAKKVHSLGTIDYLRTGDFRNIEEAYDTILSIEEKSWKHKHGTAITCSEKQRQFYRLLFTGAAAKGRLRLAVLRLNGEPVAFEVGLLKGKKYYGVHGSYDEKFRKENPGTVLLARYIEDLIHDGIQEYDWFGEPFEWESRWTDTYRRHRSLLLYNNTPKAKLFFVYNNIKSRLNKTDYNQIVLRNPRDVKPQVP